MPDDLPLAEAKRAALARLATITPADIHYARIDETAIDLPMRGANEEGFVLHEYGDCGVLREAYFFFTGTERVPLTDDEIIAVAAAAARVRPNSS